MYKIGDKIIPNLGYDYKLKKYEWWNSHKYDVMTVESILDDNDVKACSVKENILIWEFKYILPVNFLKEEDFQIN